MRKRTSVRRWKARLLRGGVFSLETVLDHPNLELAVKRLGVNRADECANYFQVQE